MSQCSTCERIFKGGPDCYDCNIFPLMEPFINMSQTLERKRQIEEEKMVSTFRNHFSRPDKHTYYLNIALAVAARSTCIRSAYGAVIVVDDQIISTGYNGSRTGYENCCDRGTCFREGSETRKNYESCPAVHAEMNSLLRSHANVKGGSLYLAGFDIKTKQQKQGKYPCINCYRAMIQAGIENIYVIGDDGRFSGGYIKCWEFLEG